MHKCIVLAQMLAAGRIPTTPILRGKCPIMSSRFCCVYVLRFCAVIEFDTFLCKSLLLH